MDSATPLQPLELAQELDGLADRHQNRARMFLGIALVVIGLGIVAVLGLPVGIAWIDRNVLEVNADAVVERLQTDIQSRTETLQSMLDKQRDLVAALNRSDQTLGEIWQRINILGAGGNPQLGRINGVTAIGDGLLAYGGNSDSYPSNFLLLKAATGIIGRLGYQSALTPPPSVSDDDEDSAAAQVSFATTKALLEERALLLPAAVRQLHDKDAPKTWQTNWTERANLQTNYEELNKARADADDWQRISRITTRIAVIALLIYLVQLCINLYRYNVKLGGFYRGRAQTLRFIAGQPDRQGYTVADLTALFAGLSPDQVGFDKQPTSPMQQIVDIARPTPRGR